MTARKPLRYYADFIDSVESTVGRPLTDEEVYEEARYRLHHVVAWWDDEDEIRYASKSPKKVLQMGKRRGIVSSIPLDKTIGALSLVPRDADGNYI